jgi:regulator of sirC expression with transglutaminase-like and TPR domain
MHQFFIFTFLLLGLTPLCQSAEPSEAKLNVLYNSLDPKSISQHFAFYELYANRPIGKKALQDAWSLITGSQSIPMNALTLQSLSATSISSLVALVNKSPDQPPPNLSETDLSLIEQLSSHLAHVKLKGHQAISENDVLQLPLEEIDLARGLFLSQFESDFYKIRLYEATIDLMALQILARLAPNATAEDKIQTINRFIFEEMGFRFPPHSIYSQDIDLYTFLPSVLDSRRGVCLGVSILYLCLAQRLALPLEMITPPGHIYVRYRAPEQVINIETTARGIHIDSKEYLSINTRALQQRTIKEVIGLAHTNQAAVYLQKGEFAQALTAYQKAAPYMKGDFWHKELMAYAYLLSGHTQMGKKLLEEVKDYTPDYAIKGETTAKDYLLGNVDEEGIKAIFKHVDEDRKSILAKKQALEKIVHDYPKFHAGLFQLAVTWLQLHRMGEALEVLRRYHILCPDDPEANYYLAVLYQQRRDYNKAWDHLRQVEAIVRTRQYEPKMLKELRKELATCCPE